MAVFLMTTTGQPTLATSPADSLRETCLRELRNVLQTQTLWVKVHAAEYLLWLGEPAGVGAVYEDERRRFEAESPYRIGIWRVLAQAAAEPAEKKRWTDKIAEAFKNESGPDRIHAAETLAKLGISPLTIDADLTRKTLKSENRPLALYTLWGATLADPAVAPANRRKFLELAVSLNEDLASRRLGAFILRRLGGLTGAEWTRLAEAALAEPASSAVRTNLLHTAWVTSPTTQPSDLTSRLRRDMLAVRLFESVGDQLELVAALSEKGEVADVPILTPLLKHENADVRAGAAYAILKIGQNTSAAK